jgi:hypothetical protein
VRNHSVLELLDAAAELDELGPEARVVRPGGVAGDEVVGQPERGRHAEQRPVLEGLVAAADIGRRGELHILARQQDLHRAGLEAGDRRAVGIGLGLAQHRLFGRRLGDEAREHRRRLLPVELGVVVLVEQEEPHRRRGDVRQPPELAGVDRPVDVQHVLGRHPHRLRDHRPLIGAVAGVPPAEVVGDAAADRVELDPAADGIAVRRGFGLLEGQHLRLQRRVTSGRRSGRRGTACRAPSARSGPSRPRRRARSASPP